MKRFRLDIVGKLEDHPRLLRAYGRVRGGEIAMVLRPLEYTGLLVRIGKDGAHQWAPAGDNLPPEWPRVEALIQKNRSSCTAVVMGGQLNNKAFRLRGQADDGDVLTVAVDVEKKTAVAAPSDAPRTPEADVDPTDAVRAIKRLQVGPGKPGAVTFRGRWAGTLICDEGRPRVELRRKLASYGWLRITSGPHGWTWSFERQEKWFSEENSIVGEPLATLVQAIDAGVVGALGQVQVACRVKDTRRRQALDTDWATTHPVPSPRETRNPTHRLREPDVAVPDKKAPARRTASAAGTASLRPSSKTATAQKKRTTRTPKKRTTRTTTTRPKPTTRTTRKSTSQKTETTRTSTSPASSAEARSASPPAPDRKSDPRKKRTTSTRRRTSTKAAPLPPTPSSPPAAPAEDAALLAAFSEAVAAALTD